MERDNHKILIISIVVASILVISLIVVTISKISKSTDEKKFVNALSSYNESSDGSESTSSSIGKTVEESENELANKNSLFDEDGFETAILANSNSTNTTNTTNNTKNESSSSGKNNDVNKSVMLLKNSVMPDNVNSTIILAAHSGNSYVGYFKNLDKLNIEDKINIYYQKNKYQYTVTNIYELDKNGHILVDKNIHENILVLTTCSKNEEKQLVVYAKLLKISDIK